METYSGLIENKDLLDFSQNFSVNAAGVIRNYLGTTLFPDQKNTIS
jgi:hypothetical protein